MRRTIALALAAALTACDFSGGSTRAAPPPAYPLDVTGAAAAPESCDSVGPTIGEPVALHLVGRRLSAEATIDLACTVTLTGEGWSEWDGAPGPLFLFNLEVSGDCLDLPTAPFANLLATRFTTTPPETFGCIHERFGDRPAVRCVVDEQCRFHLIEPRVTPLFDSASAIGDAVARAIENLILF